MSTARNTGEVTIDVPGEPCGATDRKVAYSGDAVGGTGVSLLDGVAAITTNGVHGLKVLP